MNTNLITTLATLCERDESGRHFTETTPSEVLSELEDAGLIAIYCPIHPVTGLPYSEEYWHLEITEAGLAAVEAIISEATARTVRKIMSHQSAQDAYASAHAEACALLDQLWEHLNNLPAPNQDTHWGHVGDVHALVADLKRALNEEDAA